MKSIILLLLFTIFVNTVFAQKSFTVSGQVTDSSGQLMPAVTIIEKGTNNETLSDANGKYSLDLSSENAILLISFVGYKTLEVEVNGNSKLDFKLQISAKKLNEIVITALGTGKKRDALGYSLTDVKGTEVSQIKSVNALTSLQGKVAGLTISQNATGSAGSTRVIIRGASSLTGQNQPLYVLDGIPISNITNGSVGQYGGSDGGDGISSINPDEIESIQVLKGSNASALYGSRAAGGVILIKTKTGKLGKGVGVDYSSSYTFDAIYSLRDFQTEYGQGILGGRPNSADDARRYGFYSWGPKYDGIDSFQWNGEKVPYSYIGGDNMKKFYQTGFTAVNTIGISSGNEAFSYRFSATYLKNNSIIPNSELKRTTFSLNTNVVLAKKLNNVTSIKYIDESAYNRPRIVAPPGNLNYTMMFLPGSIDIDSFKKYEDENGYELYLTKNDTRNGNPYFIINRFKINDDKYRIIASNTLTYDFFDWLYLKGRVGVDFYGIDKVLLQPYGAGYYRPGVIDDNRIKYYQLDSDLMLGGSYKYSDFTFSGLLGMNYNKVTIENQFIRGWDLIVKDIANVFNTKNISDKTRTTSEKALSGIYADIGIEYKNYLFLNLTGRQDWFSTLSLEGKTTPNNYFYPSINMSLILTKLTQLPEEINYLKLRGGWSQVAGGADQPYQLSLNYQAFNQHLGQSLGTISNSILPNKDLVPFLKDELEIGFEARFLNDRIKTDFAYYLNNTTNDIVNIRTSSFSSYSTAIANLGKVENTGVEILLTVQPIKNKNTFWEVGINGAYNIGIVKATDNQESRIDVASQPNFGNIRVSHIVGERYGALYGISYKRGANGHIVYKINSRGNPYPVEGERKVLGHGVAPLTLGLTNNVNYKGINLYFLLEGKFGGQIYSGTNAKAYDFGLHKETLKGRETELKVVGYREDGGQEETDLLEFSIDPKYIGSYYSEMSYIAEQFVYDSDYVRFKQLSIGYSLPKRILDKTFVQDITISIIGSNLFYLYNAVPNIDPESSFTNGNDQGIENFGVPTTRQYGFNVNIKL